MKSISLHVLVIVSVVRSVCMCVCMYLSLCLSTGESINANRCDYVCPTCVQQATLVVDQSGPLRHVL